MPKSVHSHVSVSFSCSRGHRAGSCPRHKGEPSNRAGTEEEGGLLWAVSCAGWSLGVSLLWLLSGNELPCPGRAPASAQPSTNYPLCLLNQSDWNHKGLILLISPNIVHYFFFPSLVHVCRNLLANLSHIPDSVISLKAIWSLHPPFISHLSYQNMSVSTFLTGLHAPTPFVSC